MVPYVSVRDYRTEYKDPHQLKPILLEGQPSFIGHGRSSTSPDRSKQLSLVQLTHTAIGLDEYRFESMNGP
jgi:hypothetical protein